MHQGHSDLKRGLKLLRLKNMPSGTKFADSLKIYQYFRKFLNIFCFSTELFNFLFVVWSPYPPSLQSINSINFHEIAKL